MSNKGTYENGEPRQDVAEYLKKYYYEMEIDNKQLVDRLGNPNLFDQEDLAEFILEITSKGIIRDYL